MPNEKKIDHEWGPNPEQNYQGWGGDQEWRENIHEHHFKPQNKNYEIDQKNGREDQQTQERKKKEHRKRIVQLKTHR